MESKETIQKARFKTLVIEREYSYLQNLEGEVLEKISTSELIANKHILTAEQFGCTRLLIQLNAPLTVYGGAGTMLHGNVIGSIACACAEYSVANANVAGSVANANAKGSVAHANAEGSVANAKVQGALVYSYDGTAYPYKHSN